MNEASLDLNDQIGLAEAIGQVRKELINAQSMGTKESLRFRMGEVKLEFAVELARDLDDTKSLGCYRTIAEKVPMHVIFEVRSAVLDAYRNGTIRESRGALFVGIIQEYCGRHGIALGFLKESIKAHIPEAITA